MTLLQGRSLRIHGNPACLATYQVQDERGGRIRALVAFIAFQRRLYEVAGLTSPNLFSEIYSTFEESLLSFEELRDRQTLNVQPDRVRIRPVCRGETLRQVAEKINNPRMLAEDLATLNRIETDSRIPSRIQSIKVVERGR